MGKIYRYECRRLLWNQFFAGLAAVLLGYGALILRGVTILGVSHTAPFSPWSFGDYLSQMLPLLWIGALFFLTFFTSPKARRTAALTDPVRRRVHGDGHTGAALYRGSGSVLQPDVRLVQLGEPSLSCAGDPSAAAGVRFGQRMAAWAAEALATVYLDANSHPSGCAALAGGSGTVERELLHRLSADTGGP